MEAKLKYIGYASLTLGFLAALLCPLAIFWGILTGFFGMIVSSIYIFIDTKNEINTKKLTPGVIGLLLSSVPVLFMLAIIIIVKINH
ncbi:MAG: hypothetical protein JWP12_2991 [Bacteroidetes bacterium]|nr:hypothetical protein [Bacteroidota bacterium]